MIVSNVLRLHTTELSEREWQRLFKKLRYRVENEIYEPWKIIPSKSQVVIPRGAWNHLPDRVTYEDRRVFPEIGMFDFHAELDAKLPDGRTFENQREAVKSILQQQQGIVVRPPGTGKTNIILATCAVIGTTSLILVHTEDILQQWIERVRDTVPDADLGVIRGSEFNIGDITVATIQTFRRRLQEQPKLAYRFGFVCLDEAHHAAASTFEQVLNEMHARYRIGVTATERRADGRHPYLQTVLGPIIHREKFRSKVPVKVHPIKEHKFKYRMRGSWDYNKGLLPALVRNEERNAIIAKKAKWAMERGHSVLVLSRRIEHLQNIGALMQGESVEILAGELCTKDQRKEILSRFKAGQLKCVLATQLADEALDVPMLSCVILTYPGKHDGRIIQQVGRALREHPGKDKAIIFDVVDDLVPVLRRQWTQRKVAYRKMGISIKKRKVK